MKGTRPTTPQTSEGERALLSQQQSAHMQIRLLSEEQFAGQIREVEQKQATRFPGGWQAHPGYREITAWPTAFSRTRFSRDELREALQVVAGRSEAPRFLSTAGRTGALATSDGYEYDATDADGESDPGAQWQIRRSGLVYQRAAMPEDLASGDIAPFVSVDATVAYVADAVDAIGRMYESLTGLDEDITVRVRMTSVAGRVLSPVPAVDGGELTCRVPEILHETTASVVELRTRRASIVVEIARDLLEQFGWDNPPARALRGLADLHVTRTIYQRYRRA